MRQNLMAILLAGMCISPFIISKIAAQESSVETVKIENLMSPSKFKAAGLQKLSAGELKTLNSWLQSFVLEVAKAGSGMPSAHTPDVIESYIEGDFEGWEGETLFKLANGQIWQQASYAYHYHYAYRPKVLIFKTTGGYKMKVDGISDTIYVQRLR